MPPKKDGQANKPAPAAKSSSSQPGSAVKMKKIEELKKENEALKFQVAKLEENFDFTNVTKKTGISEQDMNHMMPEENAKLLAKVQQLESTNNNSSSQTCAEGKSEELEKTKQQIEQKDKEIDDLRSSQKKFDSEISQLKGQLKEKASSETSAGGKSEELEKMKQQIEQKDKKISSETSAEWKSEKLETMREQIEQQEKEIKDLRSSQETFSSEIANLKEQLEEKDARPGGSVMIIPTIGTFQSEITVLMIIMIGATLSTDGLPDTLAFMVAIFKALVYCIGIGFGMYTSTRTLRYPTLNDDGKIGVAKVMIDKLKQLEKENESLRQGNSDLGVKLETANDKIANLKTELSESESARIILKEEIERASKNESPDEIKLKTDLEQMQEKYKNLNLESKAEINKKNEKIQELEDKLKEIKDEVKAKTQALKDKEEEISDKESVIKQLQDTKSAENNNKDSGSSEASLKKELEAAKRKYVDLEVKMNNIETTNNEITQNRTSLEKEIKEKDKDIIDLKKKLSASESKLEDLKVEIAANRKSFEKEIKEKDKEITELKKKLSASESTHARYESRQRNDGSKYEKELQNAHEEIEELKNRLSKMMGDQITENNPDIADLSDLNRPTKLAEKYSELYDNEWTDCYEEMENNSMNTNDILGELFGILKDIYLFSQKVSYDYEKNVKSSALTIPGIQRRPETSKLNSSTRKQLVDLRKTFAPQLASDFFKLYLQKCKENTDGRPKTKKFMNLCAEICWLMSVQDPPVVFEFEEPKGGFDKEKYKYYTKSGTQIDFIVWPPMKLHQTGPLLAKGVAQAK